MEEIWRLMQKYHKKTGDKLRLEIYHDGSGGFHDYSGRTVASFDDIWSVYDKLEELCE